MRVFAAALALALAACGGGEPSAPGSLTVDQDRELNEAAAMLDGNAVDANAVIYDAAP